MTRGGPLQTGEEGGRSRPKMSLNIRVNAETLTWAAVAVGVALRGLTYVDDRPLYRDEISLLANLVRLPVFDFHTTLTEYQLAPPGFLAIERILVRLPGNDTQAARSFPLACGIASLFAFRAVARRFLTPHAVPIAVGLFALSDWLIYYSTEIKQYSCDLLLTLAALLLAADAARSISWSPRRLAGLGAFGVIAVWFSHAVSFALAGLGSYLFAIAIVRRDRRAAAALTAVGLAWAASFAGCFFISHRLLDQGRFIWDWWDFAFLRVPPHSWAEFRFEFWQLLNVFDSPADVKTPLGPVATAILALAVATVGACSIGRRWRGGLYLLLAPAAGVLAASAMRQYPFHGRMLIFLVPSVQMLVGQGVAALARPGGPWLAGILGFSLLVQPALDALSHRLVRPLNHETFDSHGDLRPDLLDYLRIEQTDLGRSKR